MATMLLLHVYGWKDGKRVPEESSPLIVNLDNITSIFPANEGDQHGKTCLQPASGHEEGAILQVAETIHEIWQAIYEACGHGINVICPDGNYNIVWKYPEEAKTDFDRELKKARDQLKRIVEYVDLRLGDSASVDDDGRGFEAIKAIAEEK